MNARKRSQTLTNTHHPIPQIPKIPPNPRPDNPRPLLREDDSRIRQGRAQHNLAILRKLTLNLLRKEKSAKVGIAAKRKRAGWKTDYLLKVLSQ